MFKTSQIIMGYANPPNPIKVLLRFNAEQNWTPSPDNEYSGSDLMYAAVHEVYSYTLKCTYFYTQNDEYLLFLS